MYVLDQKRFQINLQEMSGIDIYLHQTADQKNSKTTTRSNKDNLKKQKTMDVSGLMSSEHQRKIA
jgi:hypothetical protein